MRELLTFSMEERARVKTHLLRIDETFEPVDFRFTDLETGEEVEVETLEHRQYRHLLQAYEEREDDGGESEADAEPGKGEEAMSPELESGRHIVVKENQTGVSYERLFGEYLREASRIEIVDPYIRRFYQIRNVQEFCDMLLRIKPEGEEVRVVLLTGADSEDLDEAEGYPHGRLPDRQVLQLGQ